MSEGLHVRLLGTFLVEGLADRELGSRKARTLLKLLAAARGAAVPVDRIVDVLWSDDLPSRPSDQVGVLVSRLRGVLGADRLLRSDAGYRLVVDWLDVDEVEARAREAAAAFGEGRLGSARAAAEAALALASGTVLPEEEGEWAETIRQATAAHIAAARRVAADAALASADHGAAVTLAEIALANDPYDEHALRTLMTAHAAAGSPASALAAYGRARHRLAEDLGVSPSAETERLHTLLLLAGDDGKAGEGGGSVGAQGGDVGAAPEPPASLVGREREWSILDRWFSSPRPPILVIEGEAGIGKSALVASWCAGGATIGTSVMVAKCDPLGRDLALQPIADALDSAIRAAGHETLAGLIAEDRAVLAAALDLGTGAPVRGAATVVHDPDDGQTRLFGALVRCIDELAGRRRTLLVVEDLHHSGRSTIAWLAHAARRSDRLSFLVTRRPGGPALPGERVVRLGPLDAAAVGQLVGPARAGELYDRSGGHPLLLSALLSAGAGPGVPSTLLEVVESQLDAVGDAAPSLRAAAILGLLVDLDLLAACVGRPAVEVLAHLEAALETGLLVDTGSGFGFRHELIRDAVLAGVPGARQVFTHREAARRLAEREQADPLAVAYHARLGGDDELAVTSLVDGARAAESRFDLDMACTLVEEALALRPSADAYEIRARVRLARLELDDAAADAALAVDTGGGARALELAGWVAYYRRLYDDARVFAERGIDATDDPGLKASCLALAGRVRHGAGDLAGALERLGATEDAPLEVRPLGDIWRAHALLHAGRPADALRLAERALYGRLQATHPFAPLHGQFARIVALGHLARVADALDGCDAFDAGIERRGDAGRRFSPIAANTRSWVLRHIGRADEADAANQHALELSAGPHGDPSAASLSEGHWVALLDLADGRLMAGDLDGVVTLLDRLGPLVEWNGTMARHQRHRLGLVRARLALAEHDLERAAHHAFAVAHDAELCGAGRYGSLARAVAALAGAVRDQEAVASIVTELETAGLDGWPLVHALAVTYDEPAWRRRAEVLAGRVVAGAGPWASAARAHVNAVLA